MTNYETMAPRGMTEQNKHDTDDKIPPIPFNLGAKTTNKKICWGFVLLGMAIICIVHLSCLHKDYYSYKKHSRIEMVLDKFEFPSVTFCNVNPMRMSQKENVPQQLQELIEAIDPRMILKSLNNYTTNAYLNMTYDGTTPTLNDVYGFIDWNISSVEKRAAKECLNCPKIEIERSPPNSIQRKFSEYLSELSEATRRQVGHQLKDMFLRCFFMGGYCDTSNVQQLMSDLYGNCYTWSAKNTLSHYNGRNKGLEMIIFLETFEYIPGAKNSLGVKMIIHDQGTFPSPWDEAITLYGGAQTFITLKRAEITRLGEPHGACDSSESYQRKYGYKYSLDLCTKICEQNLLRQTCGCIDPMEFEINKILKNPHNLRYCSYADKKDYNCIYKDYDGNTCDCNSPCKEIVYSKQVSYIRWPSLHFKNVLLAKICQDRSNQTCNRMKNESRENLINNFLEVVIYFENPGFESINEEPDISRATFAADIGGAIGLWLRLSAFTMIEILYVCLSCLFCYCKRIKG